jgi:hypothetical protein
VNPGAAVERVHKQPPQFVLEQRYRFADATVDLSSEDMEFGRRLTQIFGECLTAVGGDRGRFAGTCQVRTPGREDVVVFFDDSHPLDVLAFNLTLFPDGRYREVEGTEVGWRFLARTSDSRSFVAFRDNTMVIDRNFEWEAFTGHYMLHRMLRLQTDIMFFHGASVALEGAGVLLAGQEKSGKTTFSMALASRGSVFLGDDLAAVRLPTPTSPVHQLIPFRRAVSVRPGPRAAFVDDRISAGSYREEVYADGDIRIRALAGDFFPATPMAVPLECIFFLRGFGKNVVVERATPGLHLVELLTPLASTMWGVAPGARMMDFLRLLRRVRCFFLYSGGSVEETALTVEQTVRGTWD